MILSTTFEIPNKQYEILGIVQGSTVQYKNVGKDIRSTFVGGELKGYAEMLDKSRDIAKSNMIKQATVLGADAIIGINFSSSNIMDRTTEILVYGTAIKFI